MNGMVRKAITSLAIHGANENGKQAGPANEVTIPLSHEPVINSPGAKITPGPVKINTPSANGSSALRIDENKSKQREEF